MKLKQYSCHLCHEQWDSGDERITIDENGRYECPGCGYPFYTKLRDEQ